MKTKTTADDWAEVARDPTLRDIDHVTILGSDEWHLVGDLRAQFHLRTNHHQEDTTMTDHVPDAYGPDLAVLMTAEQKEAANMKAEAFAAIDADAADIADDVTRSLRALRAAAPLTAYEPPDGYAEGLKARR